MTDEQLNEACAKLRGIFEGLKPISEMRVFAANLTAEPEGA